MIAAFTDHGNRKFSQIPITIKMVNSAVKRLNDD